MSAAICFNLDQPKILSSGNELRLHNKVPWGTPLVVFSYVKRDLV